MNQGLSWPNRGWMLDVDKIFLLCVCVRRRSLSVGFCWPSSVWYCVRKSKSKHPPAGEKGTSVNMVRCAYNFLPLPSPVLSPSPSMILNKHTFMCLHVFFARVNLSCLWQQGTLRHPKLNPMSKSDTRLHEINRFPCNGNCKWWLTVCMWQHHIRPHCALHPSPPLSSQL